MLLPLEKRRKYIMVIVMVKFLKYRKLEKYLLTKPKSQKINESTKYGPTLFKLVYIDILKKIYFFFSTFFPYNVDAWLKFGEKRRK